MHINYCIAGNLRSFNFTCLLWKIACMSNLVTLALTTSSVSLILAELTGANSGLLGLGTSSLATPLLANAYVEFHIILFFACSGHDYDVKYA